MAGYQAGGFLPQGSSPAHDSQEGRKRTTASPTVTPVTIRQLINAKPSHGDDKFRVDGVELNMITFVGAIREVHATATNTLFKVEDGTGQIEVRRWNDKDSTAASTARLSECRENCYIRVYGNIRSFNETSHVMATHLSPIRDFNEISYHFLECIHTHLQNTRGRMTQKPSLSTALPVQKNAYSKYGDYTPRSADLGGFTMQQGQVLDVIRSYMSSAPMEEGVSETTILEQLRNVLSEKDIRDAMSWLHNEGHIYTTVDDQHFKASA